MHVRCPASDRRDAAHSNTLLGVVDSVRSRFHRCFRPEKPRSVACSRRCLRTYGPHAANNLQRRSVGVRRHTGKTCRHSARAERTRTCSGARHSAQQAHSCPNRKELFVSFACRCWVCDVVLVNFQLFFHRRAWTGRDGPSISSVRSRDAVRRCEAGESGAAR